MNGRWRNLFNRLLRQTGISSTRLARVQIGNPGFSTSGKPARRGCGPRYGRAMCRRQGSPNGPDGLREIPWGVMAMTRPASPPARSRRRDPGNGPRRKSLDPPMVNAVGAEPALRNGEWPWKPRLIIDRVGCLPAAGASPGPRSTRADLPRYCGGCSHERRDARGAGAAPDWSL